MRAQEINLDLADRDEPSREGIPHDALESLESRLWDRARRNLRLLYNGGGLAPVATATATAAALVAPMVANTKV